MELKTISSIFIVPTLKIDRNKLRDNNFLNAYVKDKHREVQYENASYLLFRPKNLNKFKDFVDGEYERTLHLVEDYDYDEFVVLVYTLDTKYKNDFELIKKGKYSKTSKEFQKLFPEVMKVMKNGHWRDEQSLQCKIFKKTDDLKEYWESKINIDFTDEMEVWDGFNEENETLDIEKIRKQVI